MTPTFLMDRFYHFKLRHNPYTKTQPFSQNGITLEQVVQYTSEEQANPSLPSPYVDPTIGYAPISYDPTGFSSDPEADNGLNVPLQEIVHIIDPLLGRITDNPNHTTIIKDNDGFFKDPLLSNRQTSVGLFETSDFLRRYEYDDATASMLEVGSLVGQNGPMFSQFYTEREVVLYQLGHLYNYNTHRKLFIYREDIAPVNTYYRAIRNYNKTNDWPYLHSKPLDRISGSIKYWRILLAQAFTKYYHRIDYSSKIL